MIVREPLCSRGLYIILFVNIPSNIVDPDYYLSTIKRNFEKGLLFYNI